MLVRAVIALLLTKLLVVPHARADDFFTRQVQPILQQHCLSCHNAEDEQGDFSLHNGSAARASGHIVPGDAASSRLIELITPTDGVAEMPQDDAPLSPEQRQVLVDWVNRGAAWPESIQLRPTTRASFDWWSYRPVSQPPIPRTYARTDAGRSWVRTPVDAFIWDRLIAADLRPAPAADRRTLIRRLSFDLLGLPPTVQQVEAFEHDTRPDAYQRLVDRMLASPAYGQRWARHWMDVVKYADTCGYDKDKLRPNAWPYRDYIIRSLNQDKPYGQFIREQIAGDILYPNTPDGILGLGFIAAGPWDFIGHVEVSGEKLDGKVARHLDRDDMLVNTMNTFCSLTVQCARCHHHKFDPISQADYYGMQAIFAAVDRAERPYESGSSDKLVYAACTNFKPQGNFKPTGGTPRPVHVLRRGNIQQPQTPAAPRLLPLDEAAPPTMAEDTPEDQRRATLARWLSDAKHPLVWRSLANRIWQYHFGRGLVGTPNDFGRMGGEPTHPQLLDWLACQLRDGDQSWKRLHRLLVTSSVYRQSSQASPQGLERDAENRWLWRMPRRRLSVEEIRDAMLCASGTLDQTMGGPGYYLFVLEKAEHSPHYEYHKFDPADPRSHRRTVYRFIVRSQPDPWMTTLDCADSSQSTPRRTETLTPLQALSMLNNRFAVLMAERLATHAASQTDDVAQQIQFAWRAVTQREASDEQVQKMLSYAQQHGLASLCRLLFNLNEFVFID